jgi:hypothetical protein
VVNYGSVLDGLYTELSDFRFRLKFNHYYAP